jgi:hypothetical protein
MMLALLRILSVLALPEGTARLEVPAGAVYRLKRVTSKADGPYCLAVIEEDAQRRALALGCFDAGGHTTLFGPGESVLRRGRYLLVAFRRSLDDAPAAVLVTTEIIKEKP